MHKFLILNGTTKSDGTTIDEAEDLDLVMLMYNLMEYSSNYSNMTGRLWFYSKDEATYCNNKFANTDDSKSFKYKAKLLKMEQIKFYQTQQLLCH